MTYAYIGAPGQLPRIVMEYGPTQVEMQMNEGEVAIECVELGEFTISADGLSLVAFVIPIDRRKEKARIAVNDRRDKAFADGYPIVGGTMDGERLQTRNESDWSNWSRAQSRYAAKVAAGLGATMGAQFRTAANNVFTVSFDDGLTILNALTDWDEAMQQHSWTLKEAIAACVDQDDLDAIDITTGWPS